MQSKGCVHYAQKEANKNSVHYQLFVQYDENGKSAEK